MTDQLPTPEPPRISVLDPVSRAVDRTTQVLFRPFDFEKWITLGFCAWLAMLGQQGGSSGSSRWNGGGLGRHDIRDGVYEAREWLFGHLVPVLLIGGFLVVLFLVLWVLCLWLSSRGKFMFVDGVVMNRGAVVDPWRRFRDSADSLFGFRVVLGLVALAVMLALLSAGATLVWFGMVVHEPTAASIAVLVLLGMVVLAIALTFALIDLAIDDFVVPLMYLNDVRVLAAWRELGGLIAAHPGAFFLYLLVRLAIVLVLVVLGVLACCLTCCLVLLPFIGTVILLPLHVFKRAYSLSFIGQLGERYARFAALGPAERLTNSTESPQ